MFSMSEKKRSIFIRFLGYAIPMLLVVYVLSIGPVCAINEHYSYDLDLQYDRNIELLESFYAPLI